MGSIQKNYINKILIVAVAWLLIVPIVGAYAQAHTFFNADEKDMFCQAGSLHLVNVYPSWDITNWFSPQKKEKSYLQWTCDLAQTNSSIPYRCVSYIHAGTSETDEIIQVNPPERFIKGVGTVDYFESSGDICLIYFTDKNLFKDNQYLYGVECFTEDGTEYGTFSKNVTIEYLSLGDVGTSWVFVKNNAGYIVGGFFMLVFLSISLLWVWGQR